MALLVKDILESEYVQVPNETAKAVEAIIEKKNNNSFISLEALGLIVNLWSYNINKFEVHKTELYKRFAKNKKTSVMNAWDELVNRKYIIEFKYRSGRKWEYVYIYRIKPYSDEEIEQKLLECVELAGVSSTSDFEKLKMSSSKCASQNQHISNIELKKDSINEKQNKSLEDIVNKELENLPDNSLSKQDLTNIANEFYSEFALNRWTKKQWVTLIDQYTTELFESGVVLTNPEAYIYSSLKTMAYKHDFKNGKVDFEAKHKNSNFPFYNWLEEGLNNKE